MCVVLPSPNLRLSPEKLGKARRNGCRFLVSEWFKPILKTELPLHNIIYKDSLLIGDTLPKTHSSQQKNGGWETTFLFRRAILRGYVGFGKGCIQIQQQQQQQQQQHGIG